MKSEHTQSGLLPANFRQEIDGKETWLFTLTNKAGSEAAILNYGARIVSLMVPDRNGVMTDVVTGHDSIADYLSSTERYFGAVCGRYGNRIANGRFTLDDMVYDKLARNNGPNHLHGGLKGFNDVIWDMKRIDNETVELSYLSTDGEEGFPGNLRVKVVYFLSEDNTLIIFYRATTDKPTVLNLTNHSFFNLSGAGNPSIDDHVLTIYADHYLPTDNTSIPYGPIEKTAGTPMDFRTPHPIGERIHDDFEQLVFGNGYDHTYILNNINGKIALEAINQKVCARCISPKTGIVMDTVTTEPGVQFYSGNWLSGNVRGKNGQRYPKRSAFCLETQHFPDSPNKQDYPSTILRPGELFSSFTNYSFSIE